MVYWCTMHDVIVHSCFCSPSLRDTPVRHPVRPLCTCVLCVSCAECCDDACPGTDRAEASTEVRVDQAPHQAHLGCWKPCSMSVSGMAVVLRP